MPAICALAKIAARRRWRARVIGPTGWSRIGISSERSAGSSAAPTLSIWGWLNVVRPATTSGASTGVHALCGTFPSTSNTGVRIESGSSCGRPRATLAAARERLCVALSQPCSSTTPRAASMKSSARIRRMLPPVRPPGASRARVPLEDSTSDAAASRRYAIQRGLATSSFARTSARSGSTSVVELGVVLAGAQRRAQPLGRRSRAAGSSAGSSRATTRQALAATASVNASGADARGRSSSRRYSRDRHEQLARVRARPGGAAVVAAGAGRPPASSSSRSHSASQVRRPIIARSSERSTPRQVAVAPAACR